MHLPRLAADPPSTRKALTWSIGWTLLGLAFTGVVAALRDGDAAGEYVTGFLIEKSLSLDNLFVFAVLFSMLGVRAQDRHKVLVLGIPLHRDPRVPRSLRHQVPPSHGNLPETAGPGSELRSNRSAICPAAHPDAPTPNRSIRCADTRSHSSAPPGAPRSCPHTRRYPCPSSRPTNARRRCAPIR